ncbi:MAG TPA: PKD domain-containing protein [Candidatus Eisenbacteria bacterium]|jgi:PKD repeat protein
MRWMNTLPAIATCSLVLTAATALSPLAIAGSSDKPREWLTIAKPAAVVPPVVRPGRILARSSLIRLSPASLADSPDIPVTTAGNRTQSENSVFVSPLNSSLLLNSDNSSDWPVTQIFGASYWVSTNGGLTWTGSTAGVGGANWGDPSTAINRSGRFFVAYVAPDFGQALSWSDDGGATWTTGTVALGFGILDKGHLWVDDGAASPYAGNLYDAWTNFQGGPPDLQIEIMRSTDAGLTWTDRQILSAQVAAGSHNQGVNIQTGPNGEVYVVWAIYDCWPCDEGAVGFAKSSDGGHTFTPGRRILGGIQGLRNTALGGEKTMRTNSFPSMTVDQQTGEIFLVWTNLGVPGVNGGDPDIYLITSSDGGETWSAPLRVNQDPIGNGRDNYFPWIVCDPVTGLLACVFYDSRNFAANDMVETFVATSTDHGLTWQDFRVSDVAWAGDGIVGFDDNYAGDYIGIAARDNRVYPMWSDDRSGRPLTYASPFVVPDTRPPVADFSGSPTSGASPLTVQFTDLSTYTPNAWLWDFGDGSGSVQQNPSHTYASVGNYTVALTASDEYGSSTKTRTNYITVTKPPVMLVQNITLTRVRQGRPNWRADARVAIRSVDGAPVEGATVTGFFSAPDSRPKLGTTDATGTAAIRSSSTKTPPAAWCFTVTGVSKSGMTYDPLRNVMTVGCQSGPAASDIVESESGAAGLERPERADIVTAADAEIEFSLEAPSPVRVEVLDVGGRRIATVAMGTLPAGDHIYTWNGRGAPSGIYFYRVRGPALLKTGKILKLAR